MTRAILSAPNALLLLVVAWAMVAFAVASATDRTVIENAGRYLPLHRYEAAAGLNRISIHGAPELRIWEVHDDAGDLAVSGHVLRHGGMATFWLFDLKGDGASAVISSINQDPALRSSLDPMLSGLAAMERIWGACGWADPDYEIEAVWQGERLHFRFDRACAETRPELGRVVDMVKG